MSDADRMQAVNGIDKLVEDISGILQRRGTVCTNVGRQGVTAIRECLLVLLAHWKPQGAM